MERLIKMLIELTDKSYKGMKICIEVRYLSIYVNHYRKY